MPVILSLIWMHAVKNACRFLFLYRINTQGIHCVSACCHAARTLIMPEISYILATTLLFFWRCVLIDLCMCFACILLSCPLKNGSEKIMLKSFLLVTGKRKIHWQFWLSYSNSSSIFHIFMAKVLFNNVWKINTPFNHPRYPVQCEPIRACAGQKVGYAMDKPPVYHTLNTQKEKYSTSIPMDNSKCPIQPTCMSLDFRRKLEHQRGHVEGTVLTTGALCCLENQQ